MPHNTAEERYALCFNLL